MNKTDATLIIKLMKIFTYSNQNTKCNKLHDDKKFNACVTLPLAINLFNATLENNFDHSKLLERLNYLIIQYSTSSMCTFVSNSG